MSKTDFDEFINKQSDEKTADKQVDWNAKRDEWLEYLSQFYKQVESFLSEYKSAGKVHWEYLNIDIFEEYIGSYPAEVLNINLGSQKVKLEPVGTNLIGAKGRVDLIGALGKVKFVLVDKNLSSPRIKISVHIKGEKQTENNIETKAIEWNWKISTPPPRIKYIEFEKDAFLGALLEVVGG